MPRQTDLADRIKRARNAAGLKQREAAEKIGVDLRTYQGWESEGRKPRDLGLIERALNVDLTTPADSQAPTLDQATDSQFVAGLAGRLADYERTVRDLNQTVTDLRQQLTDVLAGNSTASQKWAARTRIPDTD